jgi:riboflavin synthase
MFTGLVESVGSVAEVRAEPPGVRLTIVVGTLAKPSAIGDSVCINGCCLTVVAASGSRLEFQAGAETLSRANLGRLLSGDRVNIERSLAVGDLMGGHFVTGHIDAQGTLVERIDEGDWSTCWFRAPESLLRQVAEKGSIAVDGVSLTVAGVGDDRFSVALVPHTLANTTLGKLAIGGSVNLETDILAKYVERQFATRIEEVRPCSIKS